MSGLRDAREKIRATVLVADDSAAIRLMTREFLEDCGYRVIEAANGKQASEQLRLEKIDLLMTDIVMPDGEGIETITDARSKFPNLRILAMSGFSRAYLEGAARLGAHGTLRKPFKLEELRSAVEAVLASWHRDHDTAESSAQEVPMNKAVTG